MLARPPVRSHTAITSHTIVVGVSEIKSSAQARSAANPAAICSVVNVKP